MMKQLTQLLVIALLMASFIACHRNQPVNKDAYSLVKTEKTLTFPLDSETSTLMMVMFPYTDSTGAEYLTFQNARKNEILIYEMNSGKLVRKIKPPREGPDGIARLFGYYIKDLDNIYVTTMQRPRMALIDSTAKVKERIDFGKGPGELTIFYTHPISFMYQPIVIIDNKMYIVRGVNMAARPNPVTVTIDMQTKEVEILPFDYPLTSVSADKTKNSTTTYYFSRYFDGVNFVYSFYYDEEIYVTLPDHQSVRKIPVISKYIPKIEFDEIKTSGDPMKNAVENPNYGNLIFDPYRDVYYRFAYPKNEEDMNDNFTELWNYGRKIFSIMILNRDFQVIGETLFPEYLYNPGVVFVREDGLYISASHFKNPEYSDDELKFVCFRLEKNQ
jgi:hypothetical protein